jgi:hypothetical protein
MRIVAVLLALLAPPLAACAPADEASTPPPAVPAAAEEAPEDAAPAPRPLPPTDYDREIVERARAEEAEYLPPGGLPRVARTGWDRLTITAADGTRRIYLDSLAPEGLVWLHVFRGRAAPLDAYVVERWYVPEGWEVHLVEGVNGRVTEVDVPPVASPDGHRFVTANQDLVAGYTPNRVRVYRMEPTGPVMEWELEPARWGAHSPVWEDPRTIRMKWGTLTADYDVDEQPAPLYLDLTDEGWALRGALPPEG